MSIPALDLYPGPNTFPGAAIPVNIDGYPQLVQMLLGDLTLTGLDDFGAYWSASSLDGWFGSPASSLSVTQKSRGPGSWAGPRNLQSRVLSISGAVTAASPAELYAAFDRLNSAASLDASVLAVQIGADVRSCIVYRQDAVQTTLFSDTEAIWSIQLAAADPRKFATPVTGTAGLPAVTGGLTFPITFPISFASTVVSGRVALNNPGNASAPVIMQLNGPLVGPSVSHVGTGDTLSFRSSLVLGASDYVVIDMEAQTVLAQGDPNATRAALVQRALPDFGWLVGDPGDNVYAFTAVSGSGTAQVWQVPAWL